jgi:hypothetical protein
MANWDLVQIYDGTSWESDPFATELRTKEHPLVWVLQDVLRGKESDVRIQYSRLSTLSDGIHSSSNPATDTASATCRVWPLPDILCSVILAVYNWKGPSFLDRQGGGGKLCP